MLELDGRTGEGGGQLVRIAAVLTALTGQSLRVINVRGNRRFGGGLKAQHVAAIDWLAAATHATVTGVQTGSTAFTFKPKHVLLPHDTSPDNPIELRPATPAASTSLMLQAVLPYLLFARPHTHSATSVPAATISLDLYGGTHVSFAPTFDYLNQVLFPTLEQWYGVRVERELVQAGWGTGPAHSEAGFVRLVVHRPAGTTLVPKMPSLFGDKNNNSPPIITAIDATVMAPPDLLDPLAGALAREVAQCTALSPNPDELTVDLQFQRMEASGHDSRLYVLLVARTDEEGGKSGVRRWGRDYLGTETIKRTAAGVVRPKGPKKGGKGRKGASAQVDTGASAGGGFSALCDRIARRVVLDLADEVTRGGCGDSYLQDQLVVFQALSAGQTSFWGGKGKEEKSKTEGEAEKEENGPVADMQEAIEELTLKEAKGETKDAGIADDMTAPFGEGSLHASTARWVTAQVLPNVRWSANGTVCEGVGWARGSK